jgi:hypothetical protein
VNGTCRTRGVKGKKVKSSLCFLIEHHDMKAYGGAEV